MTERVLPERIQRRLAVMRAIEERRQGHRNEVLRQIEIIRRAEEERRRRRRWWPWG